MNSIVIKRVSKPNRSRALSELLREMQRYVSRTDNQAELLSIFLLSTWSGAKDVEKLKVRKDDLSRHELFLYGDVLRSLPDLIEEQGRKLVRGFGTRTERKHFRKIINFGSSIILTINARLSVYGRAKASDLPAEERLACNEALDHLSELAKNCPPLRSGVSHHVESRSARIARGLQMTKKGIRLLKESGAGNLVTQLEFEFDSVEQLVRSMWEHPNL